MHFAIVFCIGVGCANAAVRDATTIDRNSGATTTQQSNRNSGTATRARVTTRATGNTVNTTSRTATDVALRAKTARSATTTGRTHSNQNRTGLVTSARSATKSATNGTTVRSATGQPNSSSRKSANLSRAATTARAAVTNGASITFGTGYNECRDAYFTCMDQFCANQNDSYRRCVCSNRLNDIQSRERALDQTSDQLQDFKDLNIDVISKTAKEVNAMLTATDGEAAQASANDTSESAQQLAGISAVLNSSKSKSLSTAGKLDIAGDINAIWATTDLAGAANIANLTGEPLYNAVHSQCVELVADTCPSQSTLNMVVSAYGMYIENDCVNLLSALDKKLTQANGSIRATEREMNTARLENYNSHNSTPIHECIAQVRTDITKDTACGADYVHCLDITGLYLNHETGEPIYTPNFYQLENQVSLAGDVLSNPVNQLLVTELNRKRDYAARGLDTCRDIADQVWDEFMRQAIAEIYQGQQQRVRDVKTNCLNVVNECYDTQSKQLKDFSNVKDQLLLGSRMELSEEMCREKLDTCSLLYSDAADGSGLELLVNAMHDITDQKIAQSCEKTLLEYVQDICAVPSNDTVHAYPYACRVYVPGEQQYAQYPECNSQTGTAVTPDLLTNVGPPEIISQLSTLNNLLISYSSSKTGLINSNITELQCNYANGYKDEDDIYTGLTYCAASTSNTQTGEANSDSPNCGDYVGSLYHKLVRYALQACVRPTKETNVLPTSILADVNKVMDSVRINMSLQLQAECERDDGVWVSEPNPSPYGLHKQFYTETSANPQWGYCK